MTNINGRRRQHRATRPAFTALIALAVAASLVGVGAQASYASPSAVPLPPTPSATQQVGYEQELATFLAANPIPAKPTTSDLTAENAWSDAMEVYFKAAPWDAVLGQWGCTVEAPPIVGESPASKDVPYSATIGILAQCNPAVLFNPGTMAALRTKTATLADPTNSAFARQYESEVAGGPAIAASGPSPLYVTSDCITKSSAYLCLTADFGAFVISASTEWLSGSTTGYARLGVVGAGNPCANGSQLAVSATGSGGAGTVWIASASMPYDTTWSSTFWNPSRYALHCAVL